MSESQEIDPIRTAIAKLKAQRDKIDIAIQALEALGGGGTESAQSPGQSPAEGAGAFLGLSIPEAAKKLLSSRRQPMRNPEIWGALKAGGMHLNSAEPVNTIGSVLTRRFNDVGDIVRVSRGVWGLKEWYPNRSFKTEKPEEEGKSQPEK